MPIVITTVVINLYTNSNKTMIVSFTQNTVKHTDTESSVSFFYQSTSTWKQELYKRTFFEALWIG